MAADTLKSIATGKIRLVTSATSARVLRPAERLAPSAESGTQTVGASVAGSGADDEDDEDDEDDLDDRDDVDDVADVGSDMAALLSRPETHQIQEIQRDTAPAHHQYARA
jgi:hypothetical protein